jgi:exonuclease III
LDYAISSGSNKFGYKCISSPGTILSCGVAILYNPGYDVVSCSRDQDGRLLCVEFSKDGNLIQLVNIYAPSYEKPASAFFESYINYLIPTVLWGDFNTVVNPIKDRSGCNSESRSA